MALLVFLPPLARLGEVAPDAAGKAHEAAGGELHAQATLVVAAVVGAQRSQHAATFAGEIGRGWRRQRRPAGSVYIVPTRCADTVLA